MTNTDVKAYKILTSMCLSIVFDEFETMFLAYIPYPISISTDTIKMDDHDGFGTYGNSSFYL